MVLLFGRVGQHRLVGRRALHGQQLALGGLDVFFQVLDHGGSVMAALALQQQASALVDTVRVFRLDGVVVPATRVLPAAERTLLLA